MATAGDRRSSGRRPRSMLVMMGLVVILALLGAACRTTVESRAERAAPAADGTSGDGPDGPDGVEGADDSEAGPNSDGDSTAADADADGSAVPEAQDDDTDTSASSTPGAVTIADVECETPAADRPTALTDQGAAMFERHVGSDADIPSYALAVDIDPTTGAVAGAMRATVPAQDRTINFRIFAGMEAFDSGLTVENITVDGEPVDAVLDRALLSVPATAAGDADTVVELDFRFTIDQMAANTDLFGAFSGESLQPDQVGLLGRTETGMQLGHWFPVWLPDGTRTDPDPSGFGDIGAFPAANICATIIVPPGYQVVTGGSWVETTDDAVVEAGTGLRDFSMLISNDLLLAARFSRGVEIRVWGPAGDPTALMTVLDYAEQSLDVLTDAFGPYPWKEIDVISAPLGAGVGGMEWPGAVWIEQSMFAGGLPGMGDLGELFGDEGFGSLLGEIGGPALTTSLEWTVAHELGHEWWHATVGNDSIESPAVDEPLAQFSACLAMERIHPDDWRAICDAQTVDQYAQARALGVPDTAAEQASDRFESSLQYGAVVYGKAPGFYYAAADLLGWDELVASLRSFVEQNSFALVSTNTLRSHLVDEAGDDGAAIAELWDRWFRQARGDEDIEASEALGGLEGFDIESLFGEDSELFESLFGEDSELFEGLLEDLVENSGTGGD